MASFRTLFSRRDAAELAAVNVFGSHVEVAQIRRSGPDHPRVSICAQSASADNGLDGLTRLRKELRLDRFRCATALSGRKYQLQLMDAPGVPEQEFRSAIRWRLKDFLDYPVESATVDVLAVPADPNAPTRGRSVYAVASRNQDIEGCMKLFAQAKLGLAIIDIAETAQRNIATLFEIDQRAIAMLSFGEESGLLTFSARGELYLSRRIEISRNQLLEATGEAREQLFERIALELQRSLDHLDRQFSYVPLGRVLIAPLPEEIRLAEYLKGNLSATVEQVDLAEVLDFQDVPALRDPEEQMLRWLTLGTALRESMAPA